MDLSSLPRHVELGMPALSPTMESGIIGEWNVKVGDFVSAGDSIASVETDKASVDFEMTDDGYIAAILAPTGEDIAVGQPVALLVDEEEEVAAFAHIAPGTMIGGPAPAPPAAAAPASAPAPPAAVAPAAALGAVEMAPADGSNPKTAVPHYYLTVDLDLAGVHQLESQFQNAGASGNFMEAMVVKAAAQATRAVPEANTTWMDSVTRQWNDVNIACHGSAAEYVVPCADAVGIRTLAAVSESGVAGADAPATFTVDFSSGDLAFARGIVGHGQSCVLSVGQPRQEVTMGADGELQEKTLVAMTLSCDHRTVDGAVGAAWLQEFRKIFQTPALLLI